MDSKIWHHLNLKAVLSQLQVQPAHGLSTEEVRNRQKIHGANILQTEEKKHLLRMFLQHLKDPLIYVLLVAVVITILMGAYIDGIIILIVVLLNAALGMVQALRAESALAALQQLASPRALVRRDGLIVDVAARELVPGDIVMLDSGRYIPADIRLLVAINLKIDESSLTGESVAVAKNAEIHFQDRKLPLGDRLNMAYMSTLVTYGRGEGVVVGTAQDTELGKIASILKNELVMVTPLEYKLGELGKTIGKLALIIGVLLFIIGWIQGRDLATLFMTAISLAVASIPEGLAAIVAIVLSIGVTKMAKQKAIIKKLPAVETLGAVDIVCSDKTGTLTENKMQVTQLYNFTDQVVFISHTNEFSQNAKWLVTAMCLNSDATLVKEEATGDPTEIALLRLADDLVLNRDKLKAAYPRIGEMAFDSNRKMMSTLHRHADEYVIFVKGAIDSLLLKCTHVVEQGSVMPITATHKTVINAAAAKMAQGALRTLAVAYKSVPNEIAQEHFEEGLILIGLVGMMDPPRREAKMAIAAAKAAGITTVMITGDHKDTAMSIAKELGIVQDSREVISGVELESMSFETLQQQVNQYKVFARVAPEHKVNIVKAFKRQGHIVSMTGDGVNDAPSLHAADIGVAMGITGTDVAKNAAAMILADDNFSTIIVAIQEGRNIYNNIKKSVVFLLSSNMGEVIAMLLTVAIGAPLPLMATQLLWINLITDSLPAIALGMDPGSESVMKDRPRPPKESFFAKGAIGSIIIGGLGIGMVTIIAFHIGFMQHDYSMFDRNIPVAVTSYARSMAFVAIILAQLFFAFTLNQPYRFVFAKGIFRNAYLWVALIIGVLLQVLVLEIPFLAQAFQLQSLPVESWVLLIMMGCLPLILHEFYKAIRKYLL